jgi:hypothetical protein
LGIVPVVEVKVMVVVVVVVTQPPFTQASQQLDVTAWHVPPLAVHDAASSATLHLVTPLADVRQHVTAPGRPHTDFATQRSTVPRQARDSERLSRDDSTMLRAHDT